jgi:hypothetical protein
LTLQKCLKLSTNLETGRFTIATISTAMFGFDYTSSLMRQRVSYSTTTSQEPCPDDFSEEFKLLARLESPGPFQASAGFARPRLRLAYTPFPFPRKNRRSPSQESYRNDFSVFKSSTQNPREWLWSIATISTSSAEIGLYELPFDGNCLTFDGDDVTLFVAPYPFVSVRDCLQSSTQVVSPSPPFRR